MGNPKQRVTSFPTPLTSQVYGVVGNDKGYAVIATFNRDKCAILPTATSQYATGCVLIATNSVTTPSTTTAIWVNLGTPTTPTWTALTVN
jgi:hypothetical protein